MKEPIPHYITDQELLDRIQTGDETALVSLYDRYSSLLYTLALNICRQRGHAEEVLQDVFVSIWRAAGQWDAARGSVRTWIVTLTRNKSIDLLRASSRHNTFPILTEVESSAAGPADIAESRAISHEVRMALLQLPPKYREMLEAVYYGGLSQREIAQKFGLPHGTVKSRIRLAMERLARTLRARGISR